MKITSKWTCTTTDCTSLEDSPPPAPAISVEHLKYLGYSLAAGMLISACVFLAELSTSYISH